MFTTDFALSTDLLGCKPTFLLLAPERKSPLRYRLGHEVEDPKLFGVTGHSTVAVALAYGMLYGYGFDIMRKLRTLINEQGDEYCGLGLVGEIRRSGNVDLGAILLWADYMHVCGLCTGYTTDE